jgi:hypothetical protein
MDRDAPAEPVKNMFFPSDTTSCNTFCCSPLSTSFCLILTVGAESDLLLLLDPVRVGAAIFFPDLSKSAMRRNATLYF